MLVTAAMYQHRLLSPIVFATSWPPGTQARDKQGGKVSGGHHHSTPSPHLSAETWGTRISEESALLCTREVQSHLLPGCLSWELTVGVSAREERQGKPCSNEGQPCARPSTNAPASQAGFEAHALCPHSQMWKLRLHQARWHSREMTEQEPGTGTGTRDACAASAYPVRPQTQAEPGLVHLGGWAPPSTSNLLCWGTSEHEGGVAGATWPHPGTKITRDMSSQ